MSFVINALQNKGFSPLTYANRVNFLIKLGLTEDNFKQKLSDTSIVQSKSNNTTLSKVFHIISLLNNIGDDDDLTIIELMMKYRNIADKLKQKLGKQRKDNKRSKTFVDLKTLQEKLAENKPDFNSQNNSQRIYKDLEDYVILSLYINTPAIRNDFYDMKIVSNIRQTNKKDNFMVINSRGAYIILNHFKTFQSFGRVKLSIDKLTTKLIRDMLKYRARIGFKSDYLFNHISIKELTPINSYITMVLRIGNASEKFLHIHQTINDFRHAWETHIQSLPSYQTMTLEQREKEHAKLLHHMPIALEYNRV